MPSAYCAQLTRDLLATAKFLLNLGFYSLITLLIKNITSLKRFTRYGHYVGEVEDILT